MRALAALLVLAACGPEKSPSPPAPGSAAPAGAAGSAAGAGSAAADDPAAPPSPAVQEARLAAIQKAMTELRPASQQCWAAAATARFDIEGELTAQIDIAAAGAQVQLIRDTTRNTQLAACVRQLLAAYRWAPPLIGQVIQLPFKFAAPDGQNTIDRALVAWTGQGAGASRIAVRVLLDETNTGSAAASMFEVAMAAGGTTGPRWADRAELWYFLAAGEVRGHTGPPRAVAAGDMLYVPEGGVREVRAGAGELRAMIAVVPGGREGAARAGALPNREVSGVEHLLAAPVVLPASAARTVGAVTSFTRALQAPVLAAAIVRLPAGGQLAAQPGTELLYVLAGRGTLTINGVALPVTPTSVVQLPRGVGSSLIADAELRMVQVVAPAAP